MRQVTTVPFDGGGGAVVFAVAGLWRLRVRTVGLVVGDRRPRRRVTRSGRLLRLADALDAKAFPVDLSGTDAVVDADAATRLPYGVVRWPGGCSRIALGALAAAARSAARS